jgi:hypothetical protein
MSSRATSKQISECERKRERKSTIIERKKTKGS